MAAGDYLSDTAPKVRRGGLEKDQCPGKGTYLNVSPSYGC